MTAPGGVAAGVADVSSARLLALRAVYALVAVGLGLLVLPQVAAVARRGFHEGIVTCMLLAFWAACVVGLRHPLHMLPVLMWELAWKLAWLALVAWPRWRAGAMDAAFWSNVQACALVVLVALAMPWRHVLARYVRGPGEPWIAARRPSLAQPEIVR